MNPKVALIGAGVLVVLVAGILLGRHFFPVTHRGATAPPAGNVLEAPGPQMPDAGLLQAQAEPPAKEPEKSPPADIIDYLKHLQRIEAQRQAMQKDISQAVFAFANFYRNLSKALSQTDAEEQEMNPWKTLAQEAPQDYSQKWANLSQLFESKQPPPACQSLHEAYRKMLSATITYMTKVYLALQQAQTDPNAALQALSQMQGTASTDVDTQILQANYELQQILDKYDLRRYFPGFVISGDSGMNLRSIFGSVGGF